MKINTFLHDYNNERHVKVCLYDDDGTYITEQRIGWWWGLLLEKRIDRQIKRLIRLGNALRKGKIEEIK